MRIVLLSGAAVVHTVRWANGLAEGGHEVFLISHQTPKNQLNENVNFIKLPNLGSFGYYLWAPVVKIILMRIKPDIVNAHYASGYGTLARLLKFHPYVLNVWGADVYTFPKRSFLHSRLLRKNLKAASIVCSTSICMAEEVSINYPEISKESIEITPFGVEIENFLQHSRPRINKKKMVVGTVKALYPKYGIDTLILAFSKLVKDAGASQILCDVDLKLRIVGDGPLMDSLKQLTEDLGLVGCVDFVGRVDYDRVPEQLSDMDVYVALSRCDSESFGVAIVEAGATSCPVVVSNAGGLPEVVLDGVTGIVVPKDDPDSACEAIRVLLLDEQLRLKFGELGRKHVTSNYSWKESLAKMERVYEKAIRLKQGST